MEEIRYEEWRPAPRRRRDATSPLAVVLVILILGGLTLAVLFPPLEGVNSGVPVSRKLSTLNYPASVVDNVGQPVGGTWLLPTAAATIDGTRYVLDSGNNRIVKLDTGGHLAGVIDSSSDPQLQLRQPMAMASDGARLFVANSLAGEIVVLNPSGSVDRVISLEAPPDGVTPRPIGVGVAEDGHIAVSDADNHRVLILDSEGRTLHSFGTGTRAGGSQGLNVPGALTFDAAGDIFVVDILNGRIVKLTPEGEYVRDFARLADTAGSLARPKGVAVDGAGRIFVADGLQAAIEVFGPDGDYLGVIGRRDPDDPLAGSVFEAPTGLLLSGDEMLVVDGVLGLIVLRLPDPGADSADEG